MARQEQLIAFRDGSYKKLAPVSWKHSQWIHFTLADGREVSVNPANVNYIERQPAPAPPADDFEDTAPQPRGQVYVRTPTGAAMPTQLILTMEN